MRDHFWLSDEAWVALEPHLPKNQPGACRVDDRRVISGILHILKTGGRWRDVPPQYGPAKTIYNRYARWARVRRTEGRLELPATDFAEAHPQRRPSPVIRGVHLLRGCFPVLRFPSQGAASSRNRGATSLGICIVCSRYGRMPTNNERKSISAT